MDNTRGSNVVKEYLNKMEEVGKKVSWIYSVLEIQVASGFHLCSLLLFLKNILRLFCLYFYYMVI